MDYECEWDDDYDDPGPDGMDLAKAAAENRETCPWCGVRIPAGMRLDDHFCFPELVAGTTRAKVAAEARGFIRNEVGTDVGDRLYIALTHQLEFDLPRTSKGKA